MFKLLDVRSASGKPLRKVFARAHWLVRLGLQHAAWLLLLSPQLARAEATPLSLWHGGGLYLYTNRPNLQDDGVRIDCAPTTAGCLPLNLAACSGAGLPIDFTLSAPLSQAAPTYAGGTQTLYAFLSNTASCIYSSNTSQIADNGILLGQNPGLPSSAIFFQGGSLPVNVPRDLPTLNPNLSGSGAPGTLNTVALLNAFGVCPSSGGTPTNLRSLFLCVGIDGSGNKGGVNNASVAAASVTNSSQTGTGQTSAASSTDLVGYLALQVDTQPPAAPTSIAVTPKNGRARVAVAYDASLQDVYSLQVRYSKDANDLAMASEGAAGGGSCLQWTHGQVASQLVRGQADGNKVFNVDNLDNGVDYAFCAVSTDYLRNESPASTIALARPRAECDLFACAEGSLRVGYCAAGDLPGLWSLAAGAAAWATVRRRRRRPPGGRAAPLPGPKAGRGQPIAWWLVLALTLAMPSRPAEAASHAPWISSEPPVAADRNAPRGEAQDSYRAEQQAEKKALVAFGDPRQATLDFGPAKPLRTVGAVEVGLGPYSPQLGGGQMADLYRLLYRQRRHGTLFPGRPLRYRLSGSWYPFAGLTTGPYATAAIWIASAPSRLCTDGAGTPVVCTPSTVFASQEGNDTATLIALPLTLGWLYAQDLRRWLHAPLSVLARAGLTANLWWGRNGGRPSRYMGKKAEGSTINGELGLQLALDLTELSRRSRNSRTHALLFAELQYLPNGALFGSDRRHRLSFGMPTFVLIGLRAHFLRSR